MRIVVTGAGGFIGRHVVAGLQGHDVIALDVDLQSIPDAAHITKVEGDLCNPAVIAAAFASGCDVVIHLATVPGGAAEANPALAKIVNVDGTMALIDAAAKGGNCPRFVFASSIAVFGKLPVTPVIDTIPAAPSQLYGAHKLMMENWISAQTRRGAIRGLSLRLPGIVARPPSSSGMKSAFLSDIVHAIASGDDFAMPVSENATSWLCSIDTAARNICHAALFEFDKSAWPTPILMPALRAKMSDYEDALRKRYTNFASRIDYRSDPDLESVFGSHPEVSTPNAQRLGFIRDKDIIALVNAART